MGQVLLAFIVGLVLPLGVGAQQAVKVPRIGILSWEGCPGPNSVFGLAMRDLGYTWEEKIKVVCASADGSYDGLSNAAADLVSERVNVIVSLAHFAAHAAHRATKSIPIVMIASGDPMKTGLVASLARPAQT